MTEFIKNNNEILNHITDYINNCGDDDEPFYIVDLNEIISKYNTWIRMLPDVKPFFAIKSNPNIKIIQILADLGCNFDCASKNEMKTVLNIINDPSRIIFANPCKFTSHIKYAKDNDIILMTFDCVEELYKIHELHPNAELLLRLSVDDTDSLCKFNYKFGCNLNNLHTVYDVIIKLKLNLVGFSFHVGSGCKNPQNYYNAIRDCKFAYILALKYNISTIKIIDIGGGFPDASNTTVSFQEISNTIKHAINKFFDKEQLSFIAEPGRFFTESSHTLVLNVIAKKVEENKIKYYLNEGIYGSFNCIKFDYQTPEFKILDSKKPRKMFNSIFFGPTCDSIDLIHNNIEFPELDIGEWIYVSNFGSYTVSPSISFNGFSLSKYIYICSNDYNSTSPLRSLVPFIK